jgi:hypothetical protein
MTTETENSVQQVSVLYVLSLICSVLVGLSLYDNYQIGVIREEFAVMKTQVDINREDLDVFKDKTRDIVKTVNYGSAFGSASLTILTTVGTVLSIRAYFESIQKSTNDLVPPRK